jgi:hypothetical protein
MAKKKKEPNIETELSRMPAEPLLPIEKKLVGWSLGLGAVLLVMLVWMTRVLFP